MMRVVLDTNILVSTLLNPGGAPAQVFLRATGSPDIQMCVSNQVYAEYQEVIRRPKLRLGLNAINGLLGSIHDHAVWVEPEAHVLVCKDPDDDIFLECAQAADADYLVTGNAKHFPQAWMRTRVVSPRAVLNLL